MTRKEFENDVQAIIVRKIRDAMKREAVKLARDNLALGSLALLI